jgi:hypothetical protein
MRDIGKQMIQIVLSCQQRWRREVHTFFSLPCPLGNASVRAAILAKVFGEGNHRNRVQRQPPDRYFAQGGKNESKKKNYGGRCGCRPKSPNSPPNIIPRVGAHLESENDLAAGKLLAARSPVHGRRAGVRTRRINPATLQAPCAIVVAVLRICVALARRRCAQEVMQNALGLLACVATCVSRLLQLGDEWTHSVSSPRHDSRRQCNLYIFPQYL